jgi:hypothetical protein
MSAVGHSRPMHSVPVPINVRCYSKSDIIVRRSEVTLRATSGLMQRSKQTFLFDHLVGRLWRKRVHRTKCLNLAIFHAECARS